MEGTEEQKTGTAPLFTAEDQKRLDEINAQLDAFDSGGLPSESGAHSPAGEPGGFTQDDQVGMLNWLEGAEAGPGMRGDYIDMYCTQLVGEKGDAPGVARRRFGQMFSGYDRTFKAYPGFDPDTERWTDDGIEGLIRQQWQVSKMYAKSGEALAAYCNGEYAKGLGMTEQEYADAKANDPGRIVKLLVGREGFYDRYVYKTADEVLGNFDTETGTPLTGKVDESSKSWAVKRWESGIDAEYDSPVSMKRREEYVDSKYGGLPKTEEEVKKANELQRELIDRYERESSQVRRAVEVYNAIGDIRSMSADGRQALLSYMESRGGLTNVGDRDALIEFHQKRITDAIKAHDEQAGVAAWRDLQATARCLATADRRFGMTNTGRLPGRIGAGFVNTIVEGGEGVYSIFRGLGRGVRAVCSTIAAQGEGEEARQIRDSEEFVRDMLLGLTDAEVGGENTYVGEVLGETAMLFGTIVGGELVSPARIMRYFGKGMSATGKAMKGVSKANGALHRLGVKMVTKGTGITERFSGKWAKEVGEKMAALRKSAAEFEARAAASSADEIMLDGQRLLRAAEDAAVAGDYAGAGKLAAMPGQAGPKTKFYNDMADLCRKSLAELERGDTKLFQITKNIANESPMLASLAFNDYYAAKARDTYQIGQTAQDAERANMMYEDAEVFNVMDSATRQSAFIILPGFIKAATLGKIGNKAQQKAAKAFSDHIHERLAARDVDGALAAYRAFKMQCFMQGPVARVGVGSLAMAGSATAGAAIQNEKADVLGLGEKADLRNVFVDALKGGATSLGIMEGIGSALGATKAAWEKRKLRKEGKEVPASTTEQIRELGAYMRPEIAMTSAVMHVGGDGFNLKDLPSDPMLAKLEIRRRMIEFVGKDEYMRIHGQLEHGVSLMLKDMAGRDGASEAFAKWIDDAGKEFGSEFVDRVRRVQKELGYSPKMKGALVRELKYQNLVEALDARTKAGEVDVDAVKSAFQDALGIGVESVEFENGGKAVRVTFGGIDADGKPVHGAGNLLFQVGKISGKLPDGGYAKKWAYEAVNKLDRGTVEFDTDADLAKAGELQRRIRELSAEDRARLESGEDVGGILSEADELLVTPGVFIPTKGGKMIEIGTGRVVVSKDGGTSFVYGHETGHAAMHALDPWLQKPSKVESPDGSVKVGDKTFLSYKQVLDEWLMQFYPEGKYPGFDEAVVEKLLVGGETEAIEEVAEGPSVAAKIAGEKAEKQAEGIQRKATRGAGGAAVDAGKAVARGFLGQVKKFKDWLVGTEPVKDRFQQFMEDAVKQAENMFSVGDSGVKATREAAEEFRKGMRKKLANRNKIGGKKGGENVELHNDSTKEKETEKGKGEEKSSPPTPPTTEEKREVKEEENKETREDVELHTDSTNAEAVAEPVKADAKAADTREPDAVVAKNELPEVAEGYYAERGIDNKDMVYIYKGTDIVGSIDKDGVRYDGVRFLKPGEVAEWERPAEPTKNGPTIAPHEEGTTTPPKATEAPQQAPAKPGEAVEAKAKSEGAKVDLDEVLGYIEGHVPIQASWIEGEVGNGLVEFADEKALVTTADVMRAFGYWLDADNGIWVDKDADPSGWHRDQAEVAVKSVLDGKAPSGEARLHLGQVIDETGGVQGVVVRRDGELAPGARITIDGNRLPPGYSVVPFPEEPGKELMESAKKWLSAGEAIPAEPKAVEARPVGAKPENAPQGQAPVKIAETTNGSLESKSDGNFLVTVRGEDGKRRTRTLSAQHNIFAPYLLKALKAGGFPMPSIAVSNKPNRFGDQYGNDWTVVFGRSTVDPQADFRNMMFSADAWTVMDSERMRDGAKSLDEVVERMKAESNSDYGKVMRAGFDQLVERIASIDEAHSLEAAGRLKGRDKKRIAEESKKFEKAVRDAGIDKDIEYADAQLLLAIQDAQADGNPDVWGVVRDKLEEIVTSGMKEPPADIDAFNERLDAAADSIEESVSAIREVGDDYFESKPERVVKTGEIAALIAPWHYNGQYDANSGIVDAAKKLGIPVFFPKAKANVSGHVPTRDEKQKGMEAKGKAIEKALDDTDARFLVGGVYTGTGADYANRSRRGGVDDGPSLHKIGTGEGSQVYGWGLYGSSIRAIADAYAASGKVIRESEIARFPYEVRFKGRKISTVNDLAYNEDNALSLVMANGSIEKALSEIDSTISDYKKKDDAEFYSRFIKDLEYQRDWLRRNAENIEVSKKTAGASAIVYEQTFFTDRDLGDDSHLLLWYAPVEKSTLERLQKSLLEENETFSSFEKWVENEADGRDFDIEVDSLNVIARQMGLRDAHELYETQKAKYCDLSLRDRFSEPTGKAGNTTGEDVYNALAERLGGAKEASEWLAAHGIDGIKYPVDSYGGKTIKDGDKVGWNYVSFRDDNIRVDHKWRDGEQLYLAGGTLGLRRVVGDKKADEIIKKIEDAYKTVAGYAQMMIDRRLKGRPGARPKPTVGDVERAMKKPLEIDVNGQKALVHFAGDPNSGGVDRPRIEFVGVGSQIDNGKMDAIRKGKDGLTVGDLLGVDSGWIRTAYPLIWNAPVKWSELPDGVVLEAKGALAGTQNVETTTVAKQPLRTDVDTTRGRTRKSLAAATIEGERFDKDNRDNADRKLGVAVFKERLTKGEKGRKALEKDVDAAVQDLIAFEEGWYKSGTFDAKLADELRTRWSRRNHGWYDPETGEVHGGRNGGEFYKVYALFGDPKLDANNPKSVLGKTISGFIKDLLETSGKAGDRQYAEMADKMIRDAIQDALSQAYTRFSNVAESRLWAERTGLDRGELEQRGITEIADMSDQSLFRGQHVKGRTGTSDKASQRVLAYWRDVVAKKVEGLFADMKDDFRSRLDMEIELERNRRNAQVALNSDGFVKLRSIAEWMRYVENVELINRERKKKGEKPIDIIPKEQILAYYYWEHMKGSSGGYVGRVDPKTGKGVQGRRYKGGPVKIVSGNKKIGDGSNELFDMVGADSKVPEVEERPEEKPVEYLSAAKEESMADQGTDVGRTHGDESSKGGITGAGEFGMGDVMDSIEAKAAALIKKNGLKPDLALREAAVDAAVESFKRYGELNNRVKADFLAALNMVPKRDRPAVAAEIHERVKQLAGGSSFLVVGSGRRRKGVEDLMAEAAAAIIARTRNRPSKGGVKKDGVTKAREWLTANAKKVGVNEADRDAWVSAVLAEADVMAERVTSTVDAKGGDEAIIRAAQAAADSRQIAGELLVGYALGSDMGMKGGSSGERAKAMFENAKRKRAAQARGVDAGELDAAIGSDWNRYVESLGREGNPYKSGDELAAAMIAEFARRVRAKDPAFATMNDAELMSDLRVRAELSRTVAGWLEHSARELAWGDLRTDAERISARLVGVAAGGNLAAMPTFREAHEYIAKHADRLADFLEGRRTKDIIEEIEKFIDKNTHGARRPNQQERLEDRKADPVLQMYWAEVKKAIRMGSEAADNRLMKVLEELNMDASELDAQSENPDEALQKRYKLVMEAKALQQYGGLKERPSGEVNDIWENRIAVELGGAAEDFVRRQQEKVARNKAVRDAFVKEITGFMEEHGLDPATGKGRAGTSFLMYNVPDLFRRLQMHLHEGSEAYEFLENFRRETSLGHLTMHEYVATWEAEMRKAFKQCFGKDFEKMIGDLQRKRDDFDRFSRTGWYIPDKPVRGLASDEKTPLAVPPDGTHPLNTPTKLSLENLMYIYAACEQGDMAENNKIWGRDDAYKADLKATLKKELGDGAENFIAWLTSAYAEMRTQLDPVAQDVTGMRILTPTDKYCPLSFVQQRRSADTRRFAVNPFPSFLTRRVNHDKARLDESQGACRMFEERLQQAGHYIGFAKLADEIAGTLDTGDVQTAYANLLGTKVKNDVWSQLSDTLTGGRRDPGQLLNGVRNFVTASSLFGNFSSSLKQLEGIGGWGARMGLVNWLKGLVVRRWNSAEIAEACREIEKAGIFRTRGDEGISEAMQTLIDGMEGDAPRTAAGRAYKWYKRHGMDMTKLMDRVASSFMAGNYFVDRRRFYEQNGYSHEAATRAAIADVDYAINETQTSGRPEFLHAAQRGGAGGKILAQFAGPRFVRWGMEVEAFHRAFVMGDKGAKRKLLSRMVALHLVCGPMLALASALGRAIFGTKDGGDDLEEAERVTYEAAKNMAIGPMSGWFIIGNVLDAGVVSATSPEGYRGMRRYEVPLVSKLGNLTQSTAKIWKDVSECMEWGDFDGEEMDDIKKQTLNLFEMMFPASKNARGVMIRAGAAEPDE